MFKLPRNLNLYLEALPFWQWGVSWTKSICKVELSTPPASCLRDFFWWVCHGRACRKPRGLFFRLVLLWFGLFFSKITSGGEGALVCGGGFIFLIWFYDLVPTLGIPMVWETQIPWPVRILTHVVHSRGNACQVPCCLGTFPVFLTVLSLKMWRNRELSAWKRRA